MQTKWVERQVRLLVFAIVFPIVAAAIIGGLGEGVHELWNWLMPAIFKLPSIGFWQAVGLLVLSWILFGGFGWLGKGPGRRLASRRSMAQRWAHMSAEERAMLREGLRGRCGMPATTGEGSKG
jgi:hypothetical protein